MSPNGVPVAPFRLGLCLLALFCLTLSGCGAKLSASHLQKRPWQEAGERLITAKFMQFAYATQAQDESLRVTGTARAVRENLPAWADWVSGLVVHAYLCDEHGNVLAQASRHYPSQPVPGAGFEFDFVIRHQKRAPDGIFLSFGYSAMFTPSAPPRQGGQGSGGIHGNYVFYASEQAALAR